MTTWGKLPKTRHAWISAAVQRAKLGLVDGRVVTLVGIRNGNPNQLRIEFEDGNRYTIRQSEVVAVEDTRLKEER